MNDRDRKIAADLLSRHYTGCAGFFPADFLPVTGIKVVEKDKNICFLPVYLEQSSATAVLGHFIADAAANRRKLRQAAILAIQAGKELAEKSGKKYLISVFGRRSINRIADGCGFADADKIEEKIFYLNKRSI